MSIAVCYRCRPFPYSAEICATNYGHIDPKGRARYVFGLAISFKPHSAAELTQVPFVSARLAESCMTPFELAHQYYQARSERLHGVIVTLL